MVQREPLDDEYLALVREKKPYWATVIGLGDPTEVCNHDPFFEQALPDAVIKTIRATMERRPLAPSCGPPNPNAAAREKQGALTGALEALGRAHQLDGGVAAAAQAARERVRLRLN